MNKAPCTCPAGAPENGPAFQGWVGRLATSPSPAGTTEVPGMA